MVINDIVKICPKSGLTNKQFTIQNEKVMLKQGYTKNEIKTVPLKL